MKKEIKGLCASLMITGAALSLAACKKTNTAPVINGAKDNLVKAGIEFDAMEGITASDKEDGNLTSKIMIESTPKLSFKNGKTTAENAGSYELVYSVTDSDGNTVEAYSTLTVGKKTGDAVVYKAFDFGKALKVDSQGWNAKISDAAGAQASLSKGAYVFDIKNPGNGDGDIQLAKSGIGSVRIPITWHNHLIDNNYTIDPAWMARTKEVVDMALNAGLYVIINVHHDTAPSANVKYGQGYYPVESAKTESLKFLNRVWEQIAAAYKNYDERVVFELLNEPRLVGHEREWWYDDAVADCGKANKIIVEYEQACLDKIRKSGGNNKDRFILVPAYVAQPWAAMKDTFALPKDKAKGRIMLSVHMYDPWSFAGDPAGEAEFTQAAKDGLLNAFGALYDNFVKKGVPVVITECGATNKNNLSAREAWFKFYFENAKKKGITAVLWDNGVYEVTKDGDFGEHFGFYNRTEQKWYFPTLLKAALEGVKAGESR